MKAIFFFLVAFAATGYADLYPTANLKGVYVDGPQSVYPFEVVVGTTNVCKQTSMAGKTRIHKCEIQGATAEITDARGGNSRFKFDRLTIFENTGEIKETDMTIQYYYKGTWEREVQGMKLSDDVTLMIYKRKDSGDLYRGFLELSGYYTKGRVELK